MMKSNTGPELWAGIECTINRVGDEYHQQLKRNGHMHRLDDLDKFAALGIKTIRYPILWEQIAPGKLEEADWTWADERLNRLRTLGIRPIIGFLHHGSGPMHTSLTDPEFPSKLAGYAAAFAERYPWIDYYTPVNEPLTTARFSGLYGHWYPHKRDNTCFATALINQCKAIVLSMQAIREKIPDAKLVQTEDLCKIHSTPLLAYQADFENERRWLSLDLLCGRINKKHLMWDELLSYGITKETLLWFTDNACIPEIMGINHYVTSNRFLDENLDQYPRHSHGGNGFHSYADVEAVRVPDIEPCSLYTLLKEVWNRYQSPLAVTEVHLGGHREEQLRWLKECWETAQQLYTEHIDIRAITAWSLLGSFDWNSLVTRNDHFYESGVFDIRTDIIRPTALSAMISGLIVNKHFEHPVLNMPGFWKREDRFSIQHRRSLELVLSNDDTFDDTMDMAVPDISPVLIIGSDSFLATAFTNACRSRAIHYLEANITDIEAYTPWVIINTTEVMSVNLARICRQKDIQLLTFSSEQVLKNGQISPADTPGMLEKKVLDIMPTALVIRSRNFLDNIPDFVNACIDLLIDKAHGIWH
jgi:dTDP-4-dehydrorhamnose reductase